MLGDNFQRHSDYVVSVNLIKIKEGTADISNNLGFDATIASPSGVWDN